MANPNHSCDPDQCVRESAVPTDPADRAPRTLYHAHGWSEVEAFLFGSPQRFNLYRTTTAVEILSSQARDDISQVGSE